MLVMELQVFIWWSSDSSEHPAFSDWCIAASFDPPQGVIEPSEFFGEEAEQVKRKYIEEQEE